MKFVLIMSALLITGIIILLFFIRENILGKNKQTCPVGTCSTNIYSGDKDCTTSQVYDSSYQVCNPANSCTDARTPCLYEKPENGTSCPGDLGYTGICSVPNCKCVNRVYCPSYALVMFTPTNISISDNGPVITAYSQTQTYIDDSNTVRGDLPLSPGLPGTTKITCGISAGNLPAAWPQTCINGTFALNSSDGLYYCMNVPDNCKNPVRKLDGTFTCS